MAAGSRLGPLVIGVSVVVSLLPWWPPQFKRGDKRLHRVQIHGEQGALSTITVRTDETILDAGLRQGLALPYECRNGGSACVFAPSSGASPRAPPLPRRRPCPTPTRNAARR